MFFERAPPLVGAAARLPMMTSECGYIERQGSALPRCDHGGQAPAERIAKLQKAVRPRAGDIGQHDATAMQFGEDLLIDPRVVIRQLRQSLKSNVQAAHSECFGRCP